MQSTTYTAYRAATKAKRRRWDTPKPSGAVPQTVEHASKTEREDAGPDEVSDAHSFQDLRALSDLSFSVRERQDSEMPSASQTDSPTPDERLACRALAELADLNLNM